LLQFLHALEPWGPSTMKILLVLRVVLGLFGLAHPVLDLHFEIEHGEIGLARGSELDESEGAVDLHDGHHPLRPPKFSEDLP